MGLAGPSDGSGALEYLWVLGVAASLPVIPTCWAALLPRPALCSSSLQPSSAAAPAMVSRDQDHLGPKYVGLWDFKARTDEELSFQAGDIFHVTRKEEQWWWATLLDKAGGAVAQGYVPHNYLAEKETVESEPLGIVLGPCSLHCALAPGSADRTVTVGSEGTGPSLVLILVTSWWWRLLCWGLGRTGGPGWTSGRPVASDELCGGVPGPLRE
ncbi:hypothetical protein P7K49_010101 [Saguinus oedipus]|uniref:SH3 domain-containing protein n=1 Tax=Saguinus oedipus TaxID=9490 RepID=A0ABQ9VMQ6_SAGOE|nr:hypothetical protein P7K49_010101 [Saguinus oedipus]